MNNASEAMQRAAYDFIRMNHQHFATSVYSPGILKLKEKQPNDKTEILICEDYQNRKYFL